MATKPPPVPAPRRSSEIKRSCDDTCAQPKKEATVDIVPSESRCGPNRLKISSLFLAEYACTASVVHAFSFYRDTVRRNGFSGFHFGILLATPLIIASTLRAFNVPKLRPVTGLSLISVAQIALMFLNSIESEWGYYGPLMAHCVLGTGVHFIERSIERTNDSNLWMYAFFTAFTIQPFASSLLAELSTTAPHAFLSIIVLVITLLHVYVKELFNDKSAEVAATTADCQKASRQLFAFTLFYLVWSRMATVPFVVDLLPVFDRTCEALIFLTYGGSALSVLMAVFVFRPRQWLLFPAVTIVFGGLLFDSSLLVLDPKVWSIFLSKSLLGAGLAVGVFIFHTKQRDNLRCSVGGIFAIIVSTFIADRYELSIVNIVDLILLSVASIVLCLSHYYRLYKDRKSTTISLSSESSRL